ncbi:MAG: hypothetical protein M1832_001644 [Thelocarpon impressellum]|nr:MAG: hypothetical protein M1832_001644 [Thelocarpon impressellum]
MAKKDRAKLASKPKAEEAMPITWPLARDNLTPNTHKRGMSRSAKKAAREARRAAETKAAEEKEARCMEEALKVKAEKAKLGFRQTELYSMIKVELVERPFDLRFPKAAVSRPDITTTTEPGFEPNLRAATKLEKHVELPWWQIIVDKQKQARLEKLTGRLHVSGTKDAAVKTVAPVAEVGALEKPIANDKSKKRISQQKRQRRKKKVAREVKELQKQSAEEVALQKDEPYVTIARGDGALANGRQSEDTKKAHDSAGIDHALAEEVEKHSSKEQNQPPTTTLQRSPGILESRPDVALFIYKNANADTQTKYEAESASTAKKDAREILWLNPGTIISSKFVPVKVQHKRIISDSTSVPVSGSEDEAESSTTELTEPTPADSAESRHSGNEAAKAAEGSDEAPDETLTPQCWGDSEQPQQDETESHHESHSESPNEDRPGAAVEQSNIEENLTAEVEAHAPPRSLSGSADAKLPVPIKQDTSCPEEALIAAGPAAPLEEHFTSDDALAPASSPTANEVTFAQLSSEIELSASPKETPTTEESSTVTIAHVVEKEPAVPPSDSTGRAASPFGPEVLQNQPAKEAGTWEYSVLNTIYEESEAGGVESTLNPESYSFVPSEHFLAEPPSSNAFNSEGPSFAPSEHLMEHTPSCGGAPYFDTHLVEGAQTWSASEQTEAYVWNPSNLRPEAPDFIPGWTTMEVPRKPRTLMMEVLIKEALKVDSMQVEEAEAWAVAGEIQQEAEPLKLGTPETSAFPDLYDQVMPTTGTADRPPLRRAKAYSF